MAAFDSILPVSSGRQESAALNDSAFDWLPSPARQGDKRQRLEAVASLEHLKRAEAAAVPLGDSAAAQMPQTDVSPGSSGEKNRSNQLPRGEGQPDEDYIDVDKRQKFEETRARRASRKSEVLGYFVR